MSTETQWKPCPYPGGWYHHEGPEILIRYPDGEIIWHPISHNLLRLDTRGAVWRKAEPHEKEQYPCPERFL